MAFVLTTTTTPCQQENPDLWFSESRADIAEAKRLCGECPLPAFMQCEQGAADEEFGVWAGQSAAERRGETDADEREMAEASVVRLMGDGLSVRAIAAQTGYSKSKVGRIVTRLQTSAA